ncbi:hypothetical protein AURDEDRAFT_163966 [Auricularia subglabra TFB-10046 SS5]|nr:hypothetical protein AURDEDRAFT_163966 [Auricularia subglabra TFB-10046 SS5]
MSHRLVKLTIFLTRKEGMSKEEFDKYWSKEHAQLFLSTAVARELLVKYVQVYHSDEQLSQALAPMVPVVHWDGAAVFYAKGLEDFAKLFTDPEYLAKVVPDEEKFLERSKSQAMIGYEDVKYEA